MDGEQKGPLLVRGSDLVVFDDLTRFRWDRTDPGSWRLRCTWPTDVEVTQVADRLRGGARLLVVAWADEIVEHAWRDELDAAHDGVAVAAVDDFVDVHLECFDWLPSGPRARGHAFLESTRRSQQTLPQVLRPGLVVEAAPPRAECSPVVFAAASAQTRRFQIERELDQVLAHVWGER